MGIGEYAEHLIREGRSNPEVAKMVRLRYPNAQTTHRSIASYRCRMHKAGEEVRRSNGWRELRGQDAC